MNYIKFLFSVLVFSALNGFAQYTKIHDFSVTTSTVITSGGSPGSELISDGTFLYGTTSGGGANGMGTVFKIKPDGSSYSTLLNFNDINGDTPVGSLYYDGTYLYGMTYYGGKYRYQGKGVGVLYKIKPDGTGFELLLNFNGVNGFNPYGALTSDGVYLYGMTCYGGSYGSGNVFRIQKDGSGIFTLIEFDGVNNGGFPQGSLYYDGNYLYGMTQYLSNTGDGNIFKIYPDGTGFVDLKDFNGGSDGSTPINSLISDGTSLYGMTSAGGANGAGNVFKINKDGTGFLVLSDFDVTGQTGNKPQGALVLDTTTTFLYGMTSVGGPLGVGNIFKIKTDGNGFDDLMDFDGITGNFPYGSLYFDGTELYGVTSKGGNGGGNLFKIMPDGSNFINLFNFNPTVGGASTTQGDLFSDGTFLYGMTSSSGSSWGALFKVKPDGTEYDTVMNFNGSGGVTGYNSTGTLITDGTFLYGMTSLGGANSKGTVFKVKPDGTEYTTIMDFDGTNGSTPYGSLIFDTTNTFLYGMSSAGGANNKGNVFKIKYNGTGYTSIMDFNGSNGSTPYGSLIFDTTNTFLYGMTRNGGANNFGSVFKIQPDGTAYTNLLSFDNITNGRAPYGSLAYDGTYLYGMADSGGVYRYGTIFKIKPDGTGFDTLMSFNGTNGYNPRGSVIIKNNILYGMTSQGGSYHYGNIFKINIDGTSYTNLLDFNGVNGGTPYGSLITDGSLLYGMTSVSSNNGSGAVFKLCLPISSSQSYTVCNSYTVGSHTYTVSGIYIDTLASFKACDSIVTTNLTILPKSVFTQSLTVCFGQSITVGASTHTTTSTYYDVLPSAAANGCDSTVITHLTVLPANMFTQTLTINSSQSTIVGTSTYTTTGTYTDVLTSSVNGCDSTVITHLTVLTGIPENSLTNNNISVFPNPTNGLFNLQLVKPEKVELQVCDVLGKVVYVSNAVSSSNISIDLINEPEGIYFIIIKTSEGIVNKKIVVNR